MQYWYENPSVLLSNLSAFFPHKDMNMQEKMNSFVRLALYFFILSSVAYGRASHSGVYVLIGTLAATYVIGNRNPIIRPNIIVNPTNTPIVTSKSDVQPGSSGAATPFTEKSQIPQEALSPQDYTLPTRDNPFGNFDLINDPINNPWKKPMAYHGDVADQIDKHFNYNLYQDVDELFNKNNSQNRFYTMPNTTILPGDTVLFAKALYLDGSTCKENQWNCSGEWPSGDIRYHRSILVNPERNLV